VRHLVALSLFVAACGGAAEELAPVDAGHDAPADVAREANAPALDAREEPRPTRPVCRIADGGPDLECGDGAYETHLPGTWADCRALACPPGAECRTATETGVCIELPK
jgi:hypothetical protein